MRIQLPVPYDYTVRLLRSKNGKTERWEACALDEFDIPSYSSMDVHLVAEWRQAWKADRHIMAGRKTEPSAGNWGQDFQADPYIARLVLIDGKMHAPLHLETKHRSTPLMANNLINLMTLDGLSSSGIFGSHHSMLWNWQSTKKVRDTGFSLEGEEAFKPIKEDLHLREVIESGYETKRAQMNTMLKELVIVDDVIFIAVEEPCIAVEIRKGHGSTIKIAKWDDNAWGDTQLFSLSDFDAANEYFLANRTGKITRQLDAAQVLIPEALRSGVDQKELLRSLDLFIGAFREHLYDLPAELATQWYTLRDLYRTLGSEQSEDALEKLKDAALDVTAGLNNYASSNDELKTIATLGATLSERWELRPMSI
jgi:hypothetical protein